MGIQYNGSNSLTINYHHLSLFNYYFFKMPVNRGQNTFRFEHPIEYKNFSKMARFKDWSPLFEATSAKMKENPSYQHKDKIIMEKLGDMDLQVASPHVLAQDSFKEGIILKKLFGSKF